MARTPAAAAGPLVAPQAQAAQAAQAARRHRWHRRHRRNDRRRRISRDGSHRELPARRRRRAQYHRLGHPHRQRTADHRHQGIRLRQPSQRRRRQLVARRLTLLLDRGDPGQLRRLLHVDRPGRVDAGDQLAHQDSKWGRGGRVAPRAGRRRPRHDPLGTSTSTASRGSAVRSGDWVLWLRNAGGEMRAYDDASDRAASTRDGRARHLRRLLPPIQAWPRRADEQPTKVESGIVVGIVPPPLTHRHPRDHCFRHRHVQGARSPATTRAPRPSPFATRPVTARAHAPTVHKGTTSGLDRARDLRPLLHYQPVGSVTAASRGTPPRSPKRDRRRVVPALAHVDVPATTVSGAVTSTAPRRTAPIVHRPADPSQRRGRRVPLLCFEHRCPSTLVAPGTYDLYFVPRSCAGVPANHGAARSGIVVGTSALTLDLDISGHRRLGNDHRQRRHDLRHKQGLGIHHPQRRGGDSVLLAGTRGLVLQGRHCLHVRPFLREERRRSGGPDKQIGQAEAGNRRWEVARPPRHQRPYATISGNVTLNGAAVRQRGGARSLLAPTATSPRSPGSRDEPYLFRARRSRLVRPLLRRVHSGPASRQLARHLGCFNVPPAAPVVDGYSLRAVGVVCDHCSFRSPRPRAARAGGWSLRPHGLKLPAATRPLRGRERARRPPQSTARAGRSLATARASPSKATSPCGWRPPPGSLTRGGEVRRRVDSSASTD